MSNVLSQKAVLASLSISSWSARKFDRKVTNEVHETHKASSDTGRYNKRLIAREALQTINMVATAARTYHYTHTSPWLDEGPRVLPTAFYLEYAEKMREFDAQYSKAGDDFAGAYPQYVESRKKEMNGLFNAADYPPSSKIRSLFAFDITILPFPSSADFRAEIDDQQMEGIRREVEKLADVTVKRGLEDCAQRIVETIGHMSERLNSYKPGDKKKGVKAENMFRDSLVDNVRELAGLLPALNVSGNDKFSSVIDRINKQLCAADPEDLRNDDALRAKVAKNADAILADVQDYLS